ncbi:MAG: MTH1187 family thiamine-binding protein [Candidatus Aminicenantaceae bacterium]
MIIGELAIFPTSEGVSVSRYVKEVVNVIENSGLKSYTGGMATTIEAPDLRTLLDLVEKTHMVLVDMGAQRIHIDLRVDHRLDKDASVLSKLKSIDKS